MITVEAKELTKVYRIYRSPGQRLREIVFRKPLHTPFVALENINFSVLTGETLGIIGENGAGKSTLLKILARTLKPSSGSISTKGRTAALLELGAGFNPELTGEENIYLNAYLMGLSKADIDEKKQDIIAFSELGDFIGRPVKTYSSGMHVRLAFSIATSVNPDILIIDEALYFGDDYFQKKCIDRMMSFKKSGKTIIFCSHSLYHVQELCDKTMWIHGGLMKHIGHTGKVITEYQNYERGKTALLKDISADTVAGQVNTASKAVMISDVKVLDKDGSELEMLQTFQPVIVSFRVCCGQKDLKGHIGFAIVRNDEEMIFGGTSHFDNLAPVDFRDGREFRIKIKSLPLLSGIYKLVLVVADEFALHTYDMLKTKGFQVIQGRKEFGMIYIDHEWIV